MHGYDAERAGISHLELRSSRRIRVSGTLIDAPAIRLSPGQALLGEADCPEIRFAANVDGVELTTDNEVRNIRLCAASDKRSIFNDTGLESLGRMTLDAISVTGQVQILARDLVRSGHVEVKGLDIAAADTRTQTDRPHGYGVYVTQGAFALWNMQADETAVITSSLSGLSAGRAGNYII